MGGDDGSPPKKKQASEQRRKSFGSGKKQDAKSPANKPPACHPAICPLCDGKLQELQNAAGHLTSVKHLEHVWTRLDPTAAAASREQADQPPAFEKLRSEIQQLEGVDGAGELLAQKKDKLKSLAEEIAKLRNDLSSLEKIEGTEELRSQKRQKIVELQGSSDDKAMHKKRAQVVRTHFGIENINGPEATVAVLEYPGVRELHESLQFNVEAFIEQLKQYAPKRTKLKEALLDLRKQAEAMKPTANWIKAEERWVVRWDGRAVSKKGVQKGVQAHMRLESTPSLPEIQERCTFGVGPPKLAMPELPAKIPPLPRAPKYLQWPSEPTARLGVACIDRQKLEGVDLLCSTAFVHALGGADKYKDDTFYMQFRDKMQTLCAIHVPSQLSRSQNVFGHRVEVAMRGLIAEDETFYACSLMRLAGRRALCVSEIDSTDPSEENPTKGIVEIKCLLSADKPLEQACGGKVPVQISCNGSSKVACCRVLQESETITEVREITRDEIIEANRPSFIYQGQRVRLLLDMIFANEAVKKCQDAPGRAVKLTFDEIMAPVMELLPWGSGVQVVPGAPLLHQAKKHQEKKSSKRVERQRQGKEKAKEAKARGSALRDSAKQAKEAQARGEKRPAPDAQEKEAKVTLPVGDDKKSNLRPGQTARSGPSKGQKKRARKSAVRARQEKIKETQAQKDENAKTATASPASEAKQDENAKTAKDGPPAKDFTKAVLESFAEQTPKESSGLTVKVRGVPGKQCTEKRLRRAFVDCGEIASILVPELDEGGEPRGAARISFRTREAVEEALQLHGADYAGSQLAVSVAGSKGASSPAPKEPKDADAAAELQFAYLQKKDADAAAKLQAAGATPSPPKKKRFEIAEA